MIWIMSKSVKNVTRNTVKQVNFQENISQNFSRFQTLFKKGAPLRHLPNMANYNLDKNYGWQWLDFGDYIKRVVGEINMKFISIVIINILPSGEYGRELEKKKFADKDETDYLDSLEFCADLTHHHLPPKDNFSSIYPFLPYFCK